MGIVTRQSGQQIKRELERVRIANNLDMLTLTDKEGKVLVRTQHPYICG